MPEKVTAINAIGLSLTLSMCLLLLILPRRLALFPILVLTCFMSMGQKLVVVGMDFTMIRILVIFGWIRVCIRQESRGVSLNRIDLTLLCWILSGSLIYVLLRQDAEAVINRLGHLYDTIGLFFLFRFLIRDREDTDAMVRVFAVCVAVLAAFILHEKLTGDNVFAVFGYVSAQSVVRANVIRCQGPFSHPILAGTFAATNVPYFFMLWLGRGRDKWLAFLGCVACLVITVSSGSSGPMMALGFACMTMFLWPLRGYMRAVRWGILLLVMSLQLVMKVPVWFLVGRVGVFDGSTGYFRAYLIDSAIRHFGDWWLLGVESTALWGQGLFDITNEYIAQGVSGGLLTLVLFLLLISRAFGTLGRAVRVLGDESPRESFGMWILGGALLAHVVSYFSVSYFDQNIVTWLLLLATISTLGVSASERSYPSCPTQDDEPAAFRTDSVLESV